MRDTPLFDAPTPEQLALSGAFRHLLAQRGAYARYAPKKRVACDECIAYLHRHGGTGPAPRSAKSTRRALGETLRPCAAHRDLWQELDANSGAAL